MKKHKQYSVELQFLHIISNTEKKSLQVTHLHYILYIHTMKEDLRGGCKEVNTRELMWVYIIKRRN